MSKPGESTKPHLFRVTYAMETFSETRWAAVRYDAKTGLYYWSTARVPRLAYALSLTHGRAQGVNPYSNLKKYGCAQ